MTQEKSLHAQLFEATSDAVIFLNAAQRIVMFNHGAAVMFGRAAQDMLGQTLEALLPQRFVHAHGHHLSGFARGDDGSRPMGDRREIFGLRASGEEFAAEAGITKVHMDGETYLAVVMRDVTERRHFETELRNKNSELAVLQERNRLARDLHDAVTQSLFSASLMAETLPAVLANDHAAAMRQLEQIRRLNRSALAEMRGLLFELRPNAIADGRMSELLKQLADAADGRSGITFTVTCSERSRLPPAVQVGLYRIAQEACNNIIKHSKATHAEIQYTGGDTRASLLIHDNGCGFDVQSTPGGHFGLRIMRERAAEFGAHIEFDSMPGQGTDVLVSWEKPEAP